MSEDTTTKPYKVQAMLSITSEPKRVMATMGGGGAKTNAEGDNSKGNIGQNQDVEEVSRMVTLKRRNI